MGFFKKLWKGVKKIGKPIFKKVNTFLGSPFGSGLGKFAGQAFTGWQQSLSAKKNRAFQMEASSTAYQRAQEDLRKAGLNPVLAATQGGASSPGGNMAQVPDFGGAPDTAIAARRVQQLERMGMAQEADIWAATALKESQRQVQAANLFLLEQKFPKARIIREFDEKVVAPGVEAAGSAFDTMRQWMGIKPPRKLRKREPRNQINYWNTPSGRRRSGQK